MIAINKEGIFIDGVLTTNPELIGLAMLDFQETLEFEDGTVKLKDGNVFFEKKAQHEAVISNRSEFTRDSDRWR